MNPVPPQGKKPRVVAILQARMGSSRLPGKVLMEVCGRPMLELILERLRPSRCIDEMVVATTTLSQDDPIAALTERLGARAFRGSENDVLDRYYQAATMHGAKVVVRLTADCPFLDAAFLDWALERYFLTQPDYMDTNLSRTFPLGLSVEIFSYPALAAAWHEDQSAARREHVTPFIKQHPERFRLEHLGSESNWAGLRLTVDTPEDLRLARTVYERVGNDPMAPWREAVRVLETDPALRQINQHIVQKRLGSNA